MTERTTVHLLRHGEVDNPEGVLYGRLPDFHLSDLGREMADRAALSAGRSRHHRRDGLAAGAGPGDRRADAPTFGLAVGTDDRPHRGRQHLRGQGRGGR